MKILLVEDDLSLRELLSTMLAASHYTVDFATDGQQGFELADQLDYDLILLDVQLPKLDGIRLCQQLRAKGCSTPILMLTAHGSSKDVIEGLDAGADDYVIKPFDAEQLAARMRSLLRRREKVLSSPLLQWGDLTLNQRSLEVLYQGRPVPLSGKEYSLLELFLRHPQRAFSRSTILDLLWKAEENPLEGTVTNLIKDLRRKLKAVGLTEEIIETLYGLGYRLKTLPAEAKQEVDRPQEPQKYMADVQVYDQTINLNEFAAGGAIAERFRRTLGERLATIDAALQALQTQQLEQAQQQAAQEEAHRLTGTLVLFGYAHSSDVIREIEQLLQRVEWDVEWDSAQTTRIAQLRLALKKITAASETTFPVPMKLAGKALRLPETISVAPLHRETRWHSKVAVVDDDAIALETLGQMLQSEGYQVIGFTDPMQFWHQLPTLQLDLLLLDLQMPRLGGRELCQRIRQTSTQSNLPILIVTAYTDESSIHQLFAAGADDFVSKPVVGPELVTRVSNCLQPHMDHSKPLSPSRCAINPTDLDPLTQLTSRSCFEETLWQGWHALRQCSVPCALILIDVGHFRDYNRRHGYQAGDTCLQRVAQLLHATIEHWKQEKNNHLSLSSVSQTTAFSPLLARYEGDEFALWLPAAAPQDAIQVAERLLQALAHERLPHGASVPYITLNLGITTMLPQLGQAIDDLIATAEQALQTAKGNRDNGYCLLPCGRVSS